MSSGLSATIGPQNKVEDLSGLYLVPGENPYAAFINACADRHAEIRQRYEKHRTERNALSRKKFLLADFQGLVIDQYLLRLENPAIEPGFSDPRNCFVIWARPPNHILHLAAKVQEMLRAVAQDAWMMPTPSMHLTVLEVALCKTPEEISSTIEAIRPKLSEIVSHTYLHRSRLLKPQVSYDLSAFALSFVPASGEPSVFPSLAAGDTTKHVSDSDDAYTYHHLRRDVFDAIQASSVEVGSRYQVPSAHITLGRFLSNKDHDTPQKRTKWVKVIEAVNAWLISECWQQDDAKREFVGEWLVGHQVGLDARSGTVWYGGGHTVEIGKGFKEEG